MTKQKSESSNDVTKKQNLIKKIAFIVETENDNLLIVNCN